MSYLALEDASGRSVSVLPFATLKGAQEYLEWHYPAAPVCLHRDAHGQAQFTVADVTVRVTTYPDFLL